MVDIRKLTAVAVALAAGAPSARSQPAASVCQQLEMLPYQAPTTGLGAGTVFLGPSDPSAFKPSSPFSLCADAFAAQVYAKGEKKPIKATTQTFVETVSKTTNKKGSLTIEFLKGLLGPSNSIKIDGSLERGDTWQTSTGPVSIVGYTLLDAYDISPQSNSCVTSIKRHLSNAPSIDIYLVYQTAQVSDFSYKVTRKRGGSLSAPISISEIVSINPSFSNASETGNELKISKTSANLCYAQPVHYKLKGSRSIGRNVFSLERVT